jgi:hypothetical protein
MKWLPMLSVVIVVALMITDLSTGLIIAGGLIALVALLFFLEKLIGKK